MGKIIRKLELARVGRWGQNSDAITEQDLKDAVDTFTAGRPVGIGHEDTRKDSAPKFGSVLSVELSDDGRSLAGEVEFSKELDILYTSGKYDGWSVSLPKRAKDGKAYLHHLAFLGATPPKIPGLKDFGKTAFEYADGDKVVVHEFLGTINSLENTEENMNEEELKKLQAELAQAKESIEKLKAENEKLLADKKALEEKVKADGEKDDENVPAEFADKMKKMDAEMRKNRMTAFKAKVEGKVPAGLMGEVEALGNALSASDFADSSVEFADNGKAAKASPLDMLGSILSRIPQPVSEGFSGFEFSDNSDSGNGENYASKLLGAM